MNDRSIVVTDKDLSRINEVVNRLLDLGGKGKHKVAMLVDVLDRCSIVSPKEIPSSVVTINSVVTFYDSYRDEEVTARLVLSSDEKESDDKEDTIPVMSPVGGALIGSSEGDFVEWSVSSGVRSISVREILYQPEASGDYHL